MLFAVILNFSILVVFATYLIMSVFSITKYISVRSKQVTIFSLFVERAVREDQWGMSINVLTFLNV